MYTFNQHPHAAEAYSARKPGPISSRKVFGIFPVCERRAVRPTCPGLSDVAEMPVGLTPRRSQIRSLRDRDKLRAFRFCLSHSTLRVIA